MSASWAPRPEGGVTEVMVSSAVFPALSAYESALKIFSLKIPAVELSGGLWDANNALSLGELGLLGSLRLHNYFPSYEIPFVLNVASLSREIRDRSVRHVLRLIHMAADGGHPEVSFHAGFRIDPAPNVLGQRIPKQAMAPADAAKRNFLRSTETLAVEASRRGVRLLLENNPCSSLHLAEFGENPFLLSEPDELASFDDDFGGVVGLLLDVGHLKISANSFGVDASATLQELSGFVEGYHLSENDGISDSNLPFDSTAWFWDYLSASMGYVSIEAIPRSDRELLRMYELCAQKFGGRKDVS